MCKFRNSKQTTKLPYLTENQDGFSNIKQMKPQKLSKLRFQKAIRHYIKRNIEVDWKLVLVTTRLHYWVTWVCQNEERKGTNVRKQSKK